MPDRVLLTGISGVIASQVALGLLNAGYAVRGSLRSLAKADTVRHMLARAGADTTQLDFVTLDLGSDAGWTAAAKDCRYLQHIASPFELKAPKDPADTIRPAVDGTRRALEAALEAGAERIVLTSSAAAIMYGHPFDRTEPFTDSDWSNTTGPDVTTYTESKTRAELVAWSIIEGAGRRSDLVAINPTIVLGPLLGEDMGTSAITVQRLLNGTVPASPRLYFNMVDVRDVAALHVLAMTDPAAGGHRFLASAGVMSYFEMGQMLKAAFPAFAGKTPRFELPDWVVKAFAFLDPDLKESIHSVGVRRTVDASAAERLLGRPFIAPRVAVSATARSLIDYGLV